jgi:hypothetical protein
MVLLHHGMEHFDSYTRPQPASHTCSRSAFGIPFFLFLLCDEVRDAISLTS